MYSIAEALNAPGGKSQGLGPVTVKRLLGEKTVTGGKTMTSWLVEDGSGDTKLTLFEPASKQKLEVGQVITLTGEITTNEYQGKISLQTGKAVIRGGNDAPAAAPVGGYTQPRQAPAAAPAARPTTTEEKIPHTELARQMAVFTFELEQHLLQQGIQKEVVNKIIEHAPEFAALWWFGAKSLNIVNPEDVPY